MKKFMAVAVNAFVISSLVAITIPQASVISAETLVVDNTANIIAKDVAWKQKLNRNDVEFFLYNPEEYKDEFCLAQNIYFEAGIDNHAGMAAVADVTLNRVIDTRYPRSVCEVVYDGQKDSNGNMRRNRCQFSWYCDGKSDNVPEGSENWVRAQMVAWEMLHDNRFRGITEGATHYHATYVSPNWRRDRGMELIGRVGAHIFYRWN
jgi:N-acetylmuramoyl-L-alanine amidase